MKKLLFLSLFLFAGGMLFAQTELPTRAEDVSPLLIGETIPDLSLKTPEGQALSFMEALAGKKTILILYRGGWCPYCNAHLSEVGRIEQELINLGYQIVAVSPDAPRELKVTVDKNEINYRLLSDADGSFTKAVGIAFQAPERYGKRLQEVSDGANPGLLPVPTLFVLDEKGLILFEYISPDYKQRISAELLLGAAKALAGGVKE